MYAFNQITQLHESSNSQCWAPALVSQPASIQGEGHTQPPSAPEEPTCTREGGHYTVSCHGAWEQLYLGSKEEVCEPR